ncbi:tetratricopeptide repeat protein [Lacisediminihabitans profunda]|uniref:tetratricopeptide repeat protein n=1 Tax=Lacisediminihabitans profunda TaxID=2594790 RepID=UPI001FEC1B21|nr:hypothetical protein [Lacisediminihabitans profunda]
MSDSGDRGKRPGEKPGGNRPEAGRPNRGGPAGDRPRRDGDRPAGAGRGRPEADLSRNPRENRSGDRPGYQGRSPREIEDRDPFGTKSVRTRHDDPEIPESVQPKDLDRVARTQLKTLSKENADGVARHLAMVAQLIESDPALAHAHAVSAARRAGRIAVVRETLAITAYSIGDFALALRELRTYRRISGKDDQLPLMVDSERGLGRPDRALELGRSVPREGLPVDVQVQLAIAMSGARLDLGQTEAALDELKIPQLDPDKAFSWSPALFDAYAAVLEDLGREDEAEEWWQRSDRAMDALGAGDGEDDVIEVVEEELDKDVDAAGDATGTDADKQGEHAEPGRG